MRKFASRLYYYAFWIVVSVSILLSVALYIFGRDSIWRDQLYSIAASLISSVIFAILFTLLANKEFIDLIKSELEVNGREVSRQVVNEVRNFNKSYLPITEYPPTAGYDLNFNADLSADLNNTSVYVFRGISAKYVPVRIKCSNQTVSVLKIIILDPQDIRALQLSAADRSRNPKYRQKTPAELISQLQEEVFTSVIALFDCRHICTIEIGYSPETAVTRIEVFDHALYLAFYHTDQSSSLTFPDTLKYERSSLFYQIHRLESFRQFELLTKKVRFTGVDTDDQLVTHLTNIGMTETTPDKIQEYRNKYQAFQEKFILDSGIARKSRIS